MFISTAYAQAAGGSTEQLVGFLPIILMFVVLYFLMIRPQMKRAKEHKAMLEALKKGDEVITAGGVVGRITKVGEGYVTLEVARSEGKGGDAAIEMHFQKSAVQTLLPNGTIKAI
ncbi:preprotein translocase subunit YajC [Burkholderiaceae bacterium FT117]|uniref:preprotein translocase subunit YajC n=1 Tax=Zeimonas sediminis TaxID=2944268 RepID=UPI0023431574|nr:preprotein translocase subunit YajC [Zeimonas sediminis]MCM5570606.1 preprotein translocase subunit YajC [Zeimonas sediminis]